MTAKARHTTFNLDLTPAKTEKGVPVFAMKDVWKGLHIMVVNGQYFERSARNMTTDTERAIAQTEKVTEEFRNAINRFRNIEAEFVAESKKASQSVRDSTDKLSQGLARIEKAANFDRLERYVVLLERGAAAMQILADLEASGRLEKIAGAFK